jgi:hypothetical protein
MEKVQDPVIQSVIDHRQNALESISRTYLTPD